MASMPMTKNNLPKSVADFVAFRRIKSTRTLNDLVEAACIRLYDNKDFNAFLDAVYDEEAVEGSISADNILAAKMIRESVKGSDLIELETKKLASIAKAIGVVTRRYGLSRKQRQNTLGGVIVPAENTSAENN